VSFGNVNRSQNLKRIRAEIVSPKVDYESMDQASSRLFQQIKDNRSILEKTTIKQIEEFKKEIELSKRK